MFRNRNRVHLIYFLVDIFFISLSFYCSYSLNYKLIPQDIRAIRAYIPTFIFWSMALVILLKNSHLHQTDRYISISTEWVMVLRCVLLSAILVALFLFVAKVDIFSRKVFLEIAFFLLLSLSLWRTFKRIYIRDLIKRGQSNINVLIVGAGRSGLALCEEIKSNPYLGVKVVGFLDDRGINEVNGYRIIGKINDLEKVVKKYFIDEIHITIPSERRVVSEIINMGIKLGKTVRVVAEKFDLPFMQVDLNHIGPVALLTYFERKTHGTDSVVKRFLDMVIASLALILLFPLFSIISFLIKLENHGSVFYVSQRCGRKGKFFNFYKFRSMINNADNYKDALRHKSEVKGPIFKIRKDPRITRIGKFLRKYSLDEIPQLINVLKGDMSLVGPRPFPVEESQNLEYKHMPRLNIKPGITGLAQIKGRSDLSFHQWAKWDLWYYNHWSLGLDLKIIWWTIPAIFKGKGAY